MKKSEIKPFGLNFLTPDLNPACSGLQQNADINDADEPAKPEKPNPPAKPVPAPKKPGQIYHTQAMTRTSSHDTM